MPRRTITTDHEWAVSCFLALLCEYRHIVTNPFQLLIPTRYRHFRRFLKTMEDEIGRET